MYTKKFFTDKHQIIILITIYQFRQTILLWHNKFCFPATIDCWSHVLKSVLEMQTCFNTFHINFYLIRFICLCRYNLIFFYFWTLFFYLHLHCWLKLLLKNFLHLISLPFLAKIFYINYSTRHLFNLACWNMYWKFRNLFW